MSLGTIPDFSFAGPGVRLDGVVPGSPAEKAGLAKREAEETWNLLVRDDNEHHYHDWS